MRSALPILPFAAFLCIQGDSFASRAPATASAVPESTATPWRRSLNEAYKAGARLDYRAEIDALDRAIVSLQDQRDEMLKVQRDLAEGRDPAFTEAVAGLAEALGRPRLLHNCLGALSRIEAQRCEVEAIVSEGMGLRIEARCGEEEGPLETQSFRLDLGPAADLIRLERSGEIGPQIFHRCDN